MNTVTYGVNEIFNSVQGEGFWTGIPATFVRLQGCSVGCPWCDSGPMADELFGRRTNGLTRSTWGKGGTLMTAEEIAEQVTFPHVVITGGEPTLYNLDELILELMLHKLPALIQLETSGQQWLKGDVPPSWITWSPKENLDWDAPEEYYQFADEVKFVVDANLSLKTVVDRCKRFEKHDHGNVVISLMPEGTPPDRSTIERAIDFARELQYQGFRTARYSDRLQYRLGMR